jgi:hypothetical protein
VITIFWPSRILPPPTGMSAVLARTAGAFGLAGPAAEESVLLWADAPPWAGAPPAIPPLLES